MTAVVTLGIDHVGLTVRSLDSSPVPISDIVRRSQVGKLGKQIAVGLYLVAGHPSVC
jgi:hypothetical protein